MVEAVLENKHTVNIGLSGFLNVLVAVIPKVSVWTSSFMPVPYIAIDTSTSRRQPITLGRLSNQQFVLKHPIEIKVESEHKGYIFSNDDLNVYVFGESWKETLDEWEQVLIDSYCFFHNTPDDQLTTGAKILKEHLEAAIEKQ